MLSVLEAAKLMGISPQSVREKCRQGRLKGAKLRPVPGRGPEQKAWQIPEGALPERARAQTVTADIAPEPSEKPVDAGQTVGGGESAGGSPEESAGAPEGPAGAPEPEVESEDERKWKEKLAELAGETEEPGAEAAQKGPSVSFRFTPESLLLFIKRKMPAGMFERHALEIELWCFVAPDFINLDLDKFAKWIFYGVPAVITADETFRALKRRQEQLRAGQAAARGVPDAS